MSHALNEVAEKGVIEADTLHELLNSPATKDHIKLVDASIVTPDIPGNALDIYKRKRIDNAAFFDIDKVCDLNAPLPHMVPTEQDFATAVSKMGIGNDDLVIVYDQSGIAFAAARVWWMFRLFSHNKVCVLNGGLPYWEARGLPLNTTSPRKKSTETAYTATLRPDLLKTRADIEALVTKNEGHRVIDARPASRFNGQTPEPRPGIRSGHIPGSRNLPYATLMEPSTGCLLSTETLKTVLEAIAPGHVIVTSCGSGVTACVLNLAFFIAGRPNIAVYDGSWSEWGQESIDTPIATAS